MEGWPWMPFSTAQALLCRPPWAAELSAWDPEGNSALKWGDWPMQRSVPERCSADVPPQTACRGFSSSSSGYSTERQEEEGCFKQICCYRREKDRACLKTHVVWPWICRTAVHICTACMATPQSITLCEWVGNCVSAPVAILSLCFLLTLVYSMCTYLNTGKPSKAKRAPWSGRRFKSLLFLKGTTARAGASTHTDRS